MTVVIIGIPVALCVAFMLSSWGVFDEELCIGQMEVADKPARVGVPGEQDTFADWYIVPDVPCEDRRSVGIRASGSLAESERAKANMLTEQSAEAARAKALDRT